jgi:hypothetical protein
LHEYACMHEIKYEYEVIAFASKINRERLLFNQFQSHMNDIKVS